MTSVPSIDLPGIHVSSANVEGLLWGGRDSGIAWAEALPAQVDQLCQRFKISDLRLAPEMRLNLVLFGESAIHGPIVLKMAQPHKEATAEIACVRLMQESGRYARLIDADDRGAWSLQARVQPGVMLQTLAQSGEIADNDATRIIATLIQRTTTTLLNPEARFPTLDQWLRSLWEHGQREERLIPQDQIELALRHAREMIEREEPTTLIHGDFHHGNILRGEHDWVVIDPKGIVAHQAFEIGPSFYNPIGLDQRDNLTALFDQRLDIFAEVLHINRVTLWRNALVACVLSDCWSLEDGPVNHAHSSTITAALMQLPEREV